MTERELQDLLQALLIGLSVTAADEDNPIESARTFEEAGIFTHDKGLVVTASGGREFQITIVRTG
jgi:hypothetical protein